MIGFPNVKINLGLQVKDKRPDGFHNLESIFYPVNFCDVLEIVPSKSGANIFEVTGLEVPSGNVNNICVKAQKLLLKHFDIPNINMQLHKIIPMGAGLGGGSADGSFVINMLNELFELNISQEDRMQLAAELGSDCPFFIANAPAYVSGRGENVELIPLDLSGYYIVLVNPGVHISTAEAFGNLNRNTHIKSVKDIIQQPIENWRQELHNDFEGSIFASYPKIEQIKKQLYNQGATYASMTGSGSTVYGIFKEQTTSLKFDADYFIWQGKL